MRFFYCGSRNQRDGLAIRTEQTSDDTDHIIRPDCQPVSATIGGEQPERSLPKVGADRRIGGSHQQVAFAVAAEARLQRGAHRAAVRGRSEEHTSELQSLMRISYAVFCLKKKNKILNNAHIKPT